jgi:adenylate cyclase
MEIKDLIEEIEGDVVDVLATKLEYYNTTNVPRRSDPQLTFERNVEKKGKTLSTCVLFVDIRDSVALTRKHHSHTMGQVYTAFTKGVLKIAKYHNGHIRNIIGDRVMVVFPSNDCFKAAVKCAISINHFAKYVMNKKFTGVNFKCGIGIDYGDLKVLKVGIPRRGQEVNENRALVWTGYPANIASRLTDVANKAIDETYFEVVRYPINPSHRFHSLLFNYTSPLLGTQQSKVKEPYYSLFSETVEMSIEEFANSISSYKEGEISMTGGKFVSFSKKTRKVSYPEILMTADVYNGYKIANPQGNDIINKFWKEQNHEIKNVTQKTWGGDITWTIK